MSITDRDFDNGGGGKHVNLELPSATDLVKASCLKLTVEIVD